MLWPKTIGQWLSSRTKLLMLALLIVLTPLTAAVAAWWYSQARPATDTVTIAVTHLQGDDRGEARALVDEVLNEFPRARSVGIPRNLATDVVRLGDTTHSGHTQALRHIEATHSDALIWGTVTPSGVALHWTPNPDLSVALQEGKYDLIEQFDLPPLLRQELVDILRLLVATYALDLRGLDGRAAADAFFPFVVRVSDLLAHPSEGTWSAEAGASIARVLATALLRYAEQTGQAALLEDAVLVFRDILAAYPQGSREWVIAQNNLGVALATQGEWSSEQARLEAAESAFRAAVTTQMMDGMPLERAKAYMNLGNVLTALGTPRDDRANTARLEEAVSAYRAALTDDSRSRMPLAWAATQNNLGNVLKALGSLTVDTTRLEEAVAAYRDALTVGSRHRMPHQWATVQSNLASALVRLGEARADPSQLSAAVQAYRAALRERPRDQMPMVWASTQNNLGNALRAWGQIEPGTKRLQEAADAYTAALVEFTRAQSDPHIETTKRNLERTLKTINERKQL